MSRILFADAGRAAVAALVVLAACSSDAVAPTTGALSLRVDGIPADVPAAIVLSSAQSTPRTLTATETIADLAPGDYTLTPNVVVSRGSTFQPATGTTSVRIVAGQSASAVVGYQISTGSLVVLPDGLPTEVKGTFVLTAPDGSARTISGRDTLAGLTPGRYAIAAQEVVVPIDSWTPLSLGQQFDVLASTIPAAIGIPFKLITGRIALDLQDLPGGSGAPLRVTGPDGYDAQVGSAGLLRGLKPGRYTIAARSVMSAGAPWAGVPSVQHVDVHAGETPSPAGVRYTRNPPFDMTVAGLTITQTVQRADNSVPLIAGKPGILRVTVLGTDLNAEAPTVRVRFYRAGAVVHEETLSSTTSSVPLARTDDVLASTWNLPLDGTLLLPGTSVQAEVDADNRVAERDDANNRFPAAAPMPLDVRNVPPARVKVVPISQAGVVADVGAATAMLDLAYRIFPLGSIDVTVRAPFVTTVPTVQRDDGNGAWQQILRELLALRAAESSDETYYAVVRAPYSSGIAGMAYIAQPAAMGWDRQGASLASVAAHELGHTWGRLHTPCGWPDGIDPHFPNANGVAGATGWDIGGGALRLSNSPDIMGYCGDPWISDYTYEGVLGFRGTTPTNGLMASVASAPAQPGLLVWGSVTASGAVQLEPAFEVMARPSLPVRRGSVSVRGVSSDGEELFSLSFDPAAVADRPGADRAFAFVVPLDDARRGRLAALRTSGPAGAPRTAARHAPRGRTTPIASRVDAARTRIRWDAESHPAALVREAASGRIIGIVRSGDAIVPARGAVDVVLSDGVRSETLRLAP